MIARLTLTDVRSWPALTIEAAPRFVALAGENGAGKTNILEAVSLLAPGRGLRGAALSDVARDVGPGGFAVAARLDGGDEIGCGTLAAAPERRQVRVNGAGATANALAERLSVLWLTPAMDRLFAGGASERRRFLDRLTLALEPGHGRHAGRYETAMRARNKLLAEPAGDFGGGADPAWLAALEAGMAEHGAEIARARRATVDALSERLAGAAATGGFARAGIALDGWIGDLAAALRASRGRDAAAGRTLVGPHRDDLAVTHLDKRQPAARCSTGEQKALLIGIVLAHAALVAERAGRAPVLLLDEIAAHLDPPRRAALFDRLAAIGGQTWMTGTEPALFETLPADALRLNVMRGALVD